MMRLNKWAIVILLLLQQKVGDHVFFVSQHLAGILSYHSHQGLSSNPDTPNTFKDSFERHHLYSILADILVAQCISAWISIRKDI